MNKINRKIVHRRNASVIILLLAAICYMSVQFILCILQWRERGLISACLFIEYLKVLIDLVEIQS